MDDRSEFSFRTGVEGIRSRCLPTATIGSSDGVDTTQFDDDAELVSFAVITLRNDTETRINFDLRVLPKFSRSLTFYLQSGQQRAFFSVWWRWIGSLQFQVNFRSIPGNARFRSTRTLTVFNVFQTRLDGRIDHGDGRLYVFRPTAGGHDLFLA
jgi:hypothetical protein